ncbi:GspE/PulE family protein [Vibrio sp.]|uniref:GspE/PulE family protein n=1 Tax=Vibrio sp. TaxID=678 RepID=UPI003D0E46E6
MGFVVGVCADERLKNLICERSDCYVNDEGVICVTDENEEEYSDVADVLRDSTTAFGGHYFGIEPKFRLVSPEEIQDSLIKIRSHGHNQTNGVKGGENTEAKQRLQRLLELAIQHKASDIHLRLVEDRNETEISYRRDGEFLKLMENQPLEYGMTLCFYAAVTLGQKQNLSMTTQTDATFLIDTEVSQKLSNGNSKRFSKLTKWRLSQIKIDDGSKITIRNLETGSGDLPDLDALGLSKGHAQSFVDCVNAAQGAILMSGPTGSGKTTTINCALKTIKETRVVHSLEDPVEFNRPGRNHFSTAVNPDYIDTKTKQHTKSFEHYGKVLLRHDTDALYFGEVRDKKAAAQFMRLATTGQVMVGTIHCNSSLSIITTVAEQLDVPITQLAAPGIIKALAHQRLVRTLCPKCKIPHSQAHKFVKQDESLREALAAVETISDQEEKPDWLANVHYRRNWGTCSECSGRGEVGRTALFEMILIDEKGREFIRHLQLNEWEQYLTSMGWPSLRDHALSKLSAGILDYRSIIEQVDGLVKQDLKEAFAAMREG